MSHQECFWQLQHLTDEQLLESLGAVLRRQRHSLAEVVAHLGEVEERRLHLVAAYGSMFTYCVQRLGMSEDEACRRIELSRLARKFPPLFVELSQGGLSLSVALLLKPVLSRDNCQELTSAARGLSIRQARELLATRYPSPDVPSRIRKLPERRGLPTAPTPAAHSPVPAPTMQPPLPSALLQPSLAPTPTTLPIATPLAQASRQSAQPPAPNAAADDRSACHSAPHVGVSPARPAPARIDPLSAERYRVQFTADASLKAKLELARDLMRHAHRDGDLAPIVARALDLLLEKLQRRRFGTSARKSEKQGAKSTSSVAPKASPAAGPSRSSHRIDNATQRAVVERDGLGCSWLDGEGKRCGDRAFLEFDHEQPAGKGGSNEASNVRLLCAAHNHLAAERAYGRKHIERAISARRERASARRDRRAHVPIRENSDRRAEEATKAR
jgi:hypothetical protein